MQLQSSPTVLVKKGGFLSAVAHRVFMFLTAGVICVTLLGYTAMRNFSPERILSLAQRFLADPPDWAAVLPPILADAASDRRAPEYGGNVDVDVRIVRPPHERGRALAVVELHNRGEESVSFLAINVRLESADGVPLSQLTTYGATPLALHDSEWRGPLLPGATRKFTQYLWNVPESAQTVAAEICDVRVFVPRLSATELPEPASTAAILP